MPWVFGLSETDLSETDASKYDQVSKCFQEHFIKHHNLVYKQERFSQQSQQPGESIDAFVTSLHSLAEDCEYSLLWERMIRDRLVVGLIDPNLLERLQLESDLKLVDAVQKARNSKTVKSHQATSSESTHFGSCTRSEHPPPSS